MAVIITPEHGADGPAIEGLLDQVFGDRRQSKTSYRYRDGRAPVAALCRVAREDRAIVGSIRYWPVRLEPGARPALLLGPLAVDPGRRALGIGKLLVDESLSLASQLGHDLVFLVGDPVYYRRFGFVPAPATFVMPRESPARLMLRILSDGPIAEGGTLRPVAGVKQSGARAAG